MCKCIGGNFNRQPLFSQFNILAWKKFLTIQFIQLLSHVWLCDPHESQHARLLLARKPEMVSMSVFYENGGEVWLWLFHVLQEMF